MKTYTTRFGNTYTEEQLLNMTMEFRTNEKAVETFQSFLRIEKCELSFADMIDIVFTAYCKA